MFLYLHIYKLLIIRNYPLTRTLLPFETFLGIAFQNILTYSRQLYSFTCTFTQFNQQFTDNAIFVGNRTIGRVLLTLRFDRRWLDFVCVNRSSGRNTCSHGKRDFCARNIPPVFIDRCLPGKAICGGKKFGVLFGCDRMYGSAGANWLAKPDIFLILRISKCHTFLFKCFFFLIKRK